MTINALASEICKREGKRSQARIGDVREILKIIASIQAEQMMKNKDPKVGAVFALLAYATRICDKALAKARKEIGAR